MKHFFDIGGNHGQTFDYLETLDKSYKDHIFWVFEPSPRHYEKLLEKCKSMAGQYEIKVCPFGIGGSTRIAHFMEKDDFMGDSFQSKLASDHEVFTVNNGYTVYAYIKSIVEFIEEFTEPGDEIVLDIDCEGNEYEIIANLVMRPDILQRVSEAWVEWHHIDPAKMSVTPEQFSEVCSSLAINVTHRGDAI